MAFDFPTAPALNDTFTPVAGKTYVWNGYAWTLTVGAGGSVTVSDNPPASPAQGNLWWESDAGALWISYNDGNSTQWVSAVGSSGGFLPLSGGTLVGDLTIQKPGPSIALDMVGGASDQAVVYFSKGSLIRWTFNFLGNEAGGNSGTDFSIYRYNDAGAAIDAPISISRSTGDVTLRNKLSLQANGGPAPVTMQQYPGNWWLNIATPLNVGIAITDDGALNYVQASRNGVIIKGTTTNDNAWPGFVGEYQEHSTTYPGFGSGSWFPPVGIALGAGDWDVSATSVFDTFSTAAPAAWWNHYAEIIPNSITGTGTLPGWAVNDVRPGGGTYSCITIPQVRLAFAIPTTVYLQVYQNSGVSINWRGIIHARRVR